MSLWCYIKIFRYLASIQTMTHQYQLSAQCNLAAGHASLFILSDYTSASDQIKMSCWQLFIAISSTNFNQSYHCIRHEINKTRRATQDSASQMTATDVAAEDLHGLPSSHLHTICSGSRCMKLAIPGQAHSCDASKQLLDDCH